MLLFSYQRASSRQLLFEFCFQSTWSITMPVQSVSTRMSHGVFLSTPYKRICKGVCSSWLASLEPGAEVPLCIRPGSFRLPKSPDHPIVMIAPGTGVAPMRSVILERRHQREALKAEKAKGRRQGPSPDTLFFGCRCSGTGGFTSSGTLGGVVHPREG